MDNTELSLAEPVSMPVAIRQDPMAEVMHLFRMALEKNIGPDVMERMMAIRQQVRAEQAEEAYDKALADFQDECPVIKKHKAGAQGHYKYAELDDIIVQVKPLLKKHGFSYSIDSVVEDGWVTAKVKVKHIAGHSEVKEFKVPVDKRNTLMTLPQQYGGAMTFSKRYCFCNCLGIMTADGDKDGNGNRPKPKGPSTVDPDDNSKRGLTRELWDLLKEKRGAERNWRQAKQYLVDEGLITPEEAPEATAGSAPDLSVERLKAVVEKVKAKVKK